MHSSYREIRYLLLHAWCAFRRAHYFERSVWIKAFMAFAGGILAIYLYQIGLLIPALLDRLYPEEIPGRIVLSFLLYLFAGDLVMRLFLQKVPKQRIQGYLHLPVKRGALAASILMRSWFSIHSVYLLPFLIPLYRTVIVAQYGTQGFWLALAGTFLLGGINHALVLWTKTWPSRTLPWLVYTLLFAGFVVTGVASFPVHLTDLSEKIGMAFLRGSPLGFGLPVLLIVSLQTMSHRGLIRSFYQWSGAATPRPVAGNTRIEKMLEQIPVYGHYWALEWKLILRNKRSASGIRQWPITILLIPLMLHFLADGPVTPFLFVMVLAAGGYGFYHLQYVYSWESRFFDMIAARNIDLYRFIQAKYYFHFLLALLLFIPLLLLVVIARPEAAYLLAGLFFYVTGPVFAFLMYAGITNSTRIDPNKKAGFTFEGTSGTLFLTVFASIFALLFLSIPAYLLPVPEEIGLLLVTGGIGLVVILLHQWWLRATAKKLALRKYSMLTKFRNQ